MTLFHRYTKPPLLHQATYQLYQHIVQAKNDLVAPFNPAEVVSGPWTIPQNVALRSGIMLPFKRLTIFPKRHQSASCLYLSVGGPTLDQHPVGKSGQLLAYCHDPAQKRHVKMACATVLIANRWRRGWVLLGLPCFRTSFAWHVYVP